MAAEAADAALQDLVERELLTPTEAKAVVTRRDRLDRVASRAGATRADYLRFVIYELRLEKLRKLRQSKQIKAGGAIKRGPGDAWGLRQICSLYERALRRFGNDVGLWLEYIDFAGKERSKKLVGKLFARALELHSTDAALWVRAAQWEWTVNASARGARRMLQRGLRFNRASRPLWVQYFGFELLYLEQLRKRRAGLGLAAREAPAAEASDDFFAGAVAVAVVRAAFDAVEPRDAAKLQAALVDVLARFEDVQPIADAIDRARAEAAPRDTARAPLRPKKEVRRADAEAAAVRHRTARRDATVADLTLRTDAAQRAAVVWAFVTADDPTPAQRRAVDKARRHATAVLGGAPSST